MTSNVRHSERGSTLFECLVLCALTEVKVPVFSKQLRGTIYVEPGMKHILECDATGRPLPNITWFLDGKPFIGDDKVTFNANHTRYVCTL